MTYLNQDKRDSEMTTSKWRIEFKSIYALEWSSNYMSSIWSHKREIAHQKTRVDFRMRYKATSCLPYATAHTKSTSEG